MSRVATATSIARRRTGSARPRRKSSGRKVRDVVGEEVWADIEPHLTRGVGGRAGAAGTTAHRPPGQPGLALRPPRSGRQRRRERGRCLHRVLRHHPARAGRAGPATQRAGAARGQGSGRKREQRQVGVPGQHEPRDPHADERRARTDRAAARDPARRPAAAVRRDGAAARAKRCCRSSTTSSTSPRSRRASSRSKTLDFDLYQAVEDVVQLLAPRAHAKQLELACRIDERLPAAMRGDPHRLRQVLTNLIAQCGEVHRSRRSRGRGDTGRARSDPRFAVRDTGIGISADACARLFTAVRPGRRHRPRAASAAPASALRSVATWSS